MKDAIFKSIRWYIISLLVVVGFAAVMVADAGNTIRPMMAAVLSFGVAYLLLLFWQKLNRETLLVSILVYVVTAAMSYFGPDPFYVWTGIIVDWNFYYLWVALNGIVGVPVMIFSFDKFD
jgi:Na+/proline symporter